MLAGKTISHRQLMDWQFLKCQPIVYSSPFFRGSRSAEQRALKKLNWQRRALEGLPYNLSPKSETFYNEEGEIPALYIPNPKTVLVERPACNLLVHKSYPSGIPLSGSLPKELTHSRSKPISNGTRGPQDGEEEGGDDKEDSLDQNQTVVMQ